MIITIVLIVIIIYLFATIQQPYIECSKTSKDNLNINVKEQLKIGLGNNQIDEIEVIKTIILPEEYVGEDKNYLNSIRYAIKESYDYLPKDAVSIEQESDRLIVTVKVSKDETLILNNIEFVNNGELQVKINVNTKSHDVITLKIKDKYTEGELMTHLKNNGYYCK